MISLKKWFRPSPTSQDGLTQAQREAIVDLLNYCSFVDHDIAHSEEVTVDDLEFQLDWDHNTDFDYYVDKSIAVARKAFEAKDLPFFLQQISKRLDSKKSRQLAITLCEKLIEADGKVAPEESDTFNAVKNTLAR